MRIKEKDIAETTDLISPMKNQLYPVFLKLDQLETLLVGAGHVALEKLNSLLSNSPDAKITIIAPDITDEIKNLASTHHSCTIIKKPFEEPDLDGKDLVIVATNDRPLNKSIQQL